MERTAATASALPANAPACSHHVSVYSRATLGPPDIPARLSSCLHTVSGKQAPPNFATCAGADVLNQQTLLQGAKRPSAISSRRCLNTFYPAQHGQILAAVNMDHLLCNGGEELTCHDVIVACKVFGA